ncbi:hypothetical protein G7046_g6161 [Stylonectria norvegica]|nr:hypothetical protein G7046_g6161 [Stylonectria norvegica]
MWQVCVVNDAAKCLGWQIYHHVIPNSDAHPLEASLPPIRWPEMRTSTEEQQVFMDIRKRFFDTGADVWRQRDEGAQILADIHDYMDYPDGNVELLESHRRAHNNWKISASKLADIANLWTSHARAEAMEPCPAKRSSNHMFANIYQEALERYPGFIMLDGISSAGVDYVGELPRGSRQRRSRGVSPRSSNGIRKTSRKSRVSATVTLAARLSLGSAEREIRAELKKLRRRVEKLEARQNGFLSYRSATSISSSSEDGILPGNDQILQHSTFSYISASSRRSSSWDRTLPGVNHILPGMNNILPGEDQIPSGDVVSYAPGQPIAQVIENAEGWDEPPAFREIDWNGGSRVVHSPPVSPKGTTFDLVDVEVTCELPPDIWTEGMPLVEDLPSYETWPSDIWPPASELFCIASPEE